MGTLIQKVSTLWNGGTARATLHLYCCICTIIPRKKERKNGGNNNDGGGGGGDSGDCMLNTAAAATSARRAACMRPLCSSERSSSKSCNLPEGQGPSASPDPDIFIMFCKKHYYVNGNVQLLINMKIESD